jgi:hypothetical protein
MPERDYLLRLIEQAAQVLAGIVRELEEGRPEGAVQGVIHAMEQLFGLAVEDLAGLDVDQIFAQLTREEHPANARDKCLTFAALNEQAGLAFLERDLPALSQPAFHLALDFTLRALTAYPRAGAPAFAPKVDALLFQLEGFALPTSTTGLLAVYRQQAAGA